MKLAPPRIYETVLLKNRIHNFSEKYVKIKSSHEFKRITQIVGNVYQVLITYLTTP